jgi:hypothetical protein
LPKPEKKYIILIYYINPAEEIRIGGKEAVFALDSGILER